MDSLIFQFNFDDYNECHILTIQRSIILLQFIARTAFTYSYSVHTNTIDRMRNPIVKSELRFSFFCLQSKLMSLCLLFNLQTPQTNNQIFTLIFSTCEVFILFEKFPFFSVLFYRLCDARVKFSSLRLNAQTEALAVVHRSSNHRCLMRNHKFLFIYFRFSSLFFYITA